MALHNLQSELLLTGGEGGLLSLWKPRTESETDFGTNLKVTNLSYISSFIICVHLTNNHTGVSVS
jgi:hypothetical protein